MNNTILVTKAQVPTYLLSSPFLESWEDSDEPVSVSAAVLKMDTSISNLQDLDHLFATLRYWIVSDLPFSIFEYVLADSTGACVPVLRKFERDLPAVTCLLKLRRATAWTTVTIRGTLGPGSGEGYYHGEGYSEVPLPRHYFTLFGSFQRKFLALNTMISLSGVISS